MKPSHFQISVWTGTVSQGLHRYFSISDWPSHLGSTPHFQLTRKREANAFDGKCLLRTYEDSVDRSAQSNSHWSFWFWFISCVLMRQDFQPFVPGGIVGMVILNIYLVMSLCVKSWSPPTETLVTESINQTTDTDIVKLHVVDSSFHISACSSHDRGIFLLTFCCGAIEQHLSLSCSGK